MAVWSSNSVDSDLLSHLTTNARGLYSHWCICLDRGFWETTWRFVRPKRNKKWKLILSLPPTFEVVPPMGNGATPNTPVVNAPPVLLALILVSLSEWDGLQTSLLCKEEALLQKHDLKKEWAHAVVYRKKNKLFVTSTAHGKIIKPRTPDCAHGEDLFVYVR